MYAATAGQGNHLYWLHSLLLAVLASYGGGFIGPMLLGKPSGVLSNDVIIFFSIMVWYLVHHCYGHVWMNYLPVKMFWHFFLGIFRTNAIANIMNIANATLSPTSYYPTPFFGPVIVGTVVGSMGMFLPFDKGLAAIAKGTPWNMQGAFYASLFYHLMVNDQKGFVGIALRNAIGTYSTGMVMVIIAVVQVLQLQAHVLLSPEANFFTPIHKLCYMLFHVNGPKAVIKSPDVPVGWDLVARKRVRVLLESSRFLIVIGAICFHIYFTVLPTSLNTVPGLLASSTQQLQHATMTSAYYQQVIQTHSLAVGDSIGVCQWLYAIRPCQPYVMRYEEVSCEQTKLDAAVTSCKSKQDVFYQLAIYNAAVSKYQVKDLLMEIPPVQTVVLTSQQSLKSTSKVTPMLAFDAEGSIVLHHVTASDADMVNVEYVHVKHADSAATNGEAVVSIGLNGISGTILPVKKTTTPNAEL